MNLKGRREIDYRLIKNTVHQKPCTFTDLLHITKLPRKTLSLRIKQLCAMGMLNRKDRFYYTNGTHRIENVRFPWRSRVFDDTKIKTGSMLLFFILAFSVSGYVLAMITPRPEKLENLTSHILGNFTVMLNIAEVKDISGWQVVIEFNSDELTVLNVTPGDFFKVREEFPRILWDTYSGRLVMGNSVNANEEPKSGSGTLAVVAFGYFVENYVPPRIVNRSFDGFETFLIDYNGSSIDVTVEDIFALVPQQ